MSENVITEAVSDALTWQSDARNRGDQPLAPEDMFKEAARSLGSPGARVAVALLATAGLHPVPLGDDLKPSAGPLGTFAEIHQHYRNRHHDGVGVELGEHPGVTLVVRHRRRLDAVAESRRCGGAPPGE